MIMTCTRCRARTQLAEVVTYDAWDDEDNLPYRYAHGKCAVCQSPGLLCMVRVGELSGDVSEPSQLYPAVPWERRMELPSLVAESYREARLCAYSGANIATAVMVRRTLEAVTRSFDSDARSLQGGMRTMKNLGVISDELFQWGDHLRFLGNVGAHPREGESVSKDDAEDAVQFLDAIIETIYVLRPRFAASMARRPPSPTET